MNEQGKDYEAFITANKTGDWFNFKAGEKYGREESLEEIERLEGINQYLHNGSMRILNDAFELKDKLNTAKEIIKFYADQANWWLDEYDAKYSDIALPDIDECGFGGKKARKWLNDNK